jgi:putative MATE family efflux protein
MKQAESTLMTTGDYRRKLVLFTIPLFIGNLFQQLYNTADSLIVGNYLGPQALAAVSGVGSLINLFVGFFLGFSSGAGVVIGSRIGARDEQGAAQAVHTTTALGLCLSALMTVIGLFFSRQILILMGTPADVLPLSTQYLRIYFGGVSGLIMYNTFSGILQASGDSRHPLYYLIFSSLLNIVLDIVFIRFFGMGVSGAALATILAEILTALLAMHRLCQGTGLVRLELRRIRFDAATLKKILGYGFPAAVQDCVIDFSNILIQSYINSFGSLAMAGIGAATKAEGFIFLPITSAALAVTTYVSQNMGAGEYQRVKEGFRFSVVSSLLLVESLGVLSWLFAPSIVRWFNSDAQVIAIGVERIRVTALFYFLVGFSHIAAGILRGLGRPRTPMIVLLVCWCLVRVVVLFTVGQVYHSLELAFWIYPFTWTLSGLTFYWIVHRLLKENLAELAI